MNDTHHIRNIHNLAMTEDIIPHFSDNYIAAKQEKQLQLSQFTKTPIFQKIIREIIEKNIFLDEDSCRYFPEKTLSFFNILELTEQDLYTFISCMSDEKIILSQKNYQEEDNPFEHTISEKLGLKVFIMWGQGCCTQIYSAANRGTE